MRHRPNLKEPISNGIVAQRQIRDIVRTINGISQPVDTPSNLAFEAYRPVWLVKPGEPKQTEGEDPEPIAGKFNAKLIDESTLKNVDTGDLEESTLGTMPDEDNCEVWDISTLPGIHAGVTVGVNKDGQPIVVVNRPAASVLVKLYATATGSGIYYGRILTGDISIDPTQPFDIESLGLEEPEENDCVVVNMWENGISGSPAVHSLPVTGVLRYVQGFLLPGTSTDGLQQVITFAIRPL